MLVNLSVLLFRPNIFFLLTLRRSLRRKLRMRWFFDVSKVKESSLFKSDLTDPPQNFDAHLLENTDLSIFGFHFSVSFYIKIRNFLCNERVRGLIDRAREG